MPNVNATINLTAQASEIISSGVVTTQTIPAGITQGITYTSGTGSLQCDLIYAKQLSLAAAATTLDLTSLADLIGSSYSFARVRELIVQHLGSVGSQVVLVGSASASAFSAFMGASQQASLYAGGASSLSSYNAIRFSDPYTVGSTSGAVTGASSKLLKLDPGAATISVNVIILGCSAFS